MTWAKRLRINEINKGKICKTKDCMYKAKVKGYCLVCYYRNRVKKFNKGIK